MKGIAQMEPHKADEAASVFDFGGLQLEPNVTLWPSNADW